MALFDHGKPRDFLLFVRNFSMTIKASVTLTAGAKIQYLCILICGEALHQFGVLCAEVEISIPETLSSAILGLGVYFFSCL